MLDMRSADSCTRTCLANEMRKTQLEAVCIKCGAWKSAPFNSCPSCGFDPKKNEHDFVKSVYLSLGRFEDETERVGYTSALQEYSQTLQSGGEISFDPVEIERLREQKRTFEAVPTKAAWLAILRFFLPGIIFLAFLIGLLVLLKFITN